MIGRLVQSADFQRLLATPMRSRSTHFAVHHVAARPSVASRQVVHPSSTEISTDQVTSNEASVDNQLDGHWLGSVLPKRHARRSVTRNLLRRQIRAVMADHLPRLPPGLWLVRLRVPFARQDFPSAASTALRQAARTELAQLFERVGRSAAPMRTAG